jgi:hypothetical protein
MSRNKPRHKIKQNGAITSQWCSCCGYYNCDPMFAVDSFAQRKRDRRAKNKECIGCGKKLDKCSCKNKKGY